MSIDATDIDRSGPQPRAGIAAISAYVPGKHTADIGVKLHRLSSNETPLGTSPAAIAAMKACAESLELYPDGGASILREAIGERYGLDPSRIVCGAGSDEVLSLIAQGYLSRGDEAIYSEHGFLVYKIAILANSATPILAPEHHHTASVDEILSRVTDKTRIVFLANPNNPTGTYIPFDEVKRLHSGLPTNVLLLLDAAYAEYVRRNDYEAGIELVSTSNNVVMTRTFSKIYGLASLRLGWAYAPAAVADVLNRIRGPFNVSAPAIAAGAAAIRDQAFVDAAVQHNDRWLPWLTQELSALGLEVTPSVGNFILIHFPDENGKRAEDADTALTKVGVLGRRVTAYGFPNALRLSIGLEDSNQLIVDTLRDLMAPQA